MIDQKTSLLIPSQLPEFIRDDPSYDKFVLFLQAYYEWLEQNNNVIDRTKNLLDYKDVDKTSEEFLDYFYNDFLSYFPKDILADKQKVVKLAKQLYQSKGTPSSYKFLFRLLYNSDVDFFYTKDAVLKASSGKWYIAKSLKLDSTDKKWLTLTNKNGSFRVFGLTTKSIATIENVLLVGSKIEVFISDIERLFQSGEIIRVVDSNNQPILFEGKTLEAKIVGQISQINVNPSNRGLLYLPGDPVVVYGGLNSNNGHGAAATIKTTTSGSIQRISVLNGGFGYTQNTAINITNASGAIAIIGSLDPSSANTANVTFIPSDRIGSKTAGGSYTGISIGAANYNFANVMVSDANTTLSNAFSFLSFQTYPISSILVENGGGGISKTPIVTAETTYNTQDGVSIGYLKNLGILAPIQIASGGTGYLENDTINIIGGSGYGVYANVTSVDADGQILAVKYVYPNPDIPHHYPLGGLGHRTSNLPTLTVNSANTEATGANLYVSGILGQGANFGVVVDRVGSIIDINVTDYGEDYISTPNISLKVQDIVVSNLLVGNLPNKGDIIYQGSSLNSASYIATVDSIDTLVSNGDPLQSLWKLRVYNYSSILNFSLPINVYSKDIIMNMSNEYTTINKNSRYNSSGVITYGDGTAEAGAKFLNGLVISEGKYLDSTGQLSAFDVLQSENYNNYTYEIIVEKEIAKYRKILLDLLHPTGLKVLGKYVLKSQSEFKVDSSISLYKAHTLAYYTSNIDAYATMTSDWTNLSANVVQIYGNDFNNLSDFVYPGNTFSIVTTNDEQVSSEVVSVDDANNTITLKDSTWLTIPNVAIVTGNTGDYSINISELTGNYNIINNGIYNNNGYPYWVQPFLPLEYRSAGALNSIVYVEDQIKFIQNDEIKTVIDIDYDNGILTLDSPLSNNINSLMSVKRNVYATDVKIFGLIN
jgi:hypothetical protein